MNYLKIITQKEWKTINFPQTVNVTVDTIKLFLIYIANMI